jgi:hypothetical protein
LNIADTSLSLVTDLTSNIIELETRLASHTPLIDDEKYIHRQLDDLNELDNHLQTIEKSIKELLIQSKQLGNERLIRISEQLSSRWKQINLEITQRFELIFFKLIFSLKINIENDQLHNVLKLIDRLKNYMNKKNVHLIIYNVKRKHLNQYLRMLINFDKWERLLQ